jgi:hypothetical protein
MPEGGLHGVAKRPIGGRVQLVGHKGRQASVLAERVELVRGRADRHVRGEEILPDPGIGAVGIDANGQIVYHGQGRGHACELGGEEPWHPPVEPHALTARGREARYGRDFLPFVNPNLSNFFPHLHDRLTMNPARIIARPMTQHGHEDTQQSVANTA